MFIENQSKILLFQLFVHQQGLLDEVREYLPEELLKDEETILSDQPSSLADISDNSVFH